MHDAVTDRIDRPGALELCSERGLVDALARSGQVGREQLPIVPVEQRELEAARAGVNGEDAHSAPPGLLAVLLGVLRGRFPGGRQALLERVRGCAGGCFGE